MQLKRFKAELVESVEDLDEHYETSEQRLASSWGSFLIRTTIPNSLAGLFDVAWDFPSVDPPEYLRQLSPQLFEAGSADASLRFEQAVELAEQAFFDELSKLVSHSDRTAQRQRRRQAKDLPRFGDQELCRSSSIASDI